MAEYAWKCPSCGKRYNNKQDLLEHSWRKHGMRIKVPAMCVRALYNATPDQAAYQGCSVEGFVGKIRPHDWPEDFEHENGRYECRCYKCGSMFTGHKRRVCCKVCSNMAISNTSQNSPPINNNERNEQ